MNIFTQIRILWAIQPAVTKINKILKENNMKLTVNAVVQVLGTALQGVNAISGVLPARMQFWAMIAISSIQGLVAVLGHFSNPDGTPVSTPYAPAK